MWNFKLLLLCLTILAPALVQSQQQEILGDLLKNLLQGDELKTFQKTYQALPLEVRDKLTKDLLTNPGQLGKNIYDLVGPMLAPQLQTLFQNFGGQAPAKQLPSDSENEVEVDSVEMDYNKGGNRRTKPQSGFDFSQLGGMLGNLITSNPQMLLQMASGFLQNNGNQGQAAGQGLSFESIAGMLTQQIDLDTVVGLAQSFGLFEGSSKSPSNERRRGEGEPQKKQGIADMLQITELIKQWTTFISSPLGQKVNRILPRILKSQTLPDALRILEKETSFRFDIILRQLQDPVFRQVLVSQAVKPIGRFFESITIPNDFKDVLSRADDVLNNKLGLGVKAKETIEPVFNYIRDTFSITHESLLDFKANDIEKIATDVLNKEILDPLAVVWDAHEKARKNSVCAQFIYCQLNHNYYNENFIRRNVIKTSSIISAFQVSAAMKRDAFSHLYEGAYKGIEGFDCTHGINTRCLELMNTAAHNEL